MRYSVFEFDDCMTGKKLVTIIDSWTGNIFVDGAVDNPYYQEYLAWKE